MKGTYICIKFTILERCLHYLMISPRIPYKRAHESQLSNYRSISLLKSEDKVFERLIFKQLFNHLRDNNVLTSMQSGFIPGESTVNQLTFLYNTFCRARDDGKEVRVFFCDINKAFDRVWHAGLIHKLEAAGASGCLRLWFENYFLIENSELFCLRPIPKGPI